MVNKVIFQGRLVADPVIRYTASDVANLEVTIAWSEKYKEVETKCFLRCKAWRNTAEFIGKYFTKGQEIVIEGQMVTEQWEDNGEKKNRTICMIEKCHFCGSKANSNTNSNQPLPNPMPTDAKGFMDIPDDIDEECPFS